MKKYFFLQILILLVGSSALQAQCPTVTPQQNLNKYWEYRERLKDFVYPGDCWGCGMPSNDRGPVSGNGTIFYFDALEELGYYIGVVSTEYYLLGTASDSASVNQRQRDIAELYYAINEVYKCDMRAKGSWRYWYNHTSSYAPAKGDTNGFLIRDEVLGTFQDTMRNNDYVENWLNNSLAPIPDGHAYDVANVTSNWVNQGIQGKFSPWPFIPCDIENGGFSGATPLSIDNYSQLLIGLALVSRFIPSGVIYNGQYLQKMVLDEEERIYHLAATNFYTFENTITGHCGAGVNWAVAPHAFDWCKCNMGGSELLPPLGLGIDGLVCSHYAIQNNFSGWIPAFTPRWNGIYTTVYVGSPIEFIMCTLATIGNVWGPLTPTIVGNIALKDANPKHKSAKCDIQPILYEALWGSKVVGYDTNFYNDLLSSAPCHGVPPGGGHSYNWSSGNRIDGTNGPFGSVGFTTYSDVYSGLDYLLFFNLFEIAFPTISGTTGKYVNYKYVHPKDLRESYLVKSSNPGETNEKNFWASDSIKAGKINPGDHNYVIKNDNDPNQPLFQGRAQITFRAGHSIDLDTGFEAQSGVFFDASIDTTINAMYCESCADIVNVDSLDLPIDTSVTGQQVNWLTTDTIRDCSCHTFFPFGINGDTAGITSWYWDFGNGQTSNVYNPSVTYCPARKIDSTTGYNDTTYLLTLIVTDSAGTDTLQAIIYFRGCEHTSHKATKPSQNNEIISTDTTTFKVINTLTQGNSTIEYYLPKGENVVISIYNLMGIKLGSLVNGPQPPGKYSVIIDNGKYSEGMYFITMEAGDFVQTKKIILMKR